MSVETGVVMIGGADVLVNGKEASTYQSNLEQTLREVLEHLGYKVEIEYEDE